jgi:predicted enzyme related to lactoylglutathione lyase
MANILIDMEPTTIDFSPAKTLYENIFDWKIQDIPMSQSSHSMIDVNERTEGIAVKQLMPGALLSMLHFDTSVTLRSEGVVA